ISPRGEWAAVNTCRSGMMCQLLSGKLPQLVVNQRQQLLRSALTEASESDRQRFCLRQWRAFPVDAVAKRGVACAPTGRPCCSLRAGHPKLAFRSFHFVRRGIALHHRPLCHRRDSTKPQTMRAHDPLSLTRRAISHFLVAVVALEVIGWLSFLRYTA